MRSAHRTRYKIHMKTLQNLTLIALLFTVAAWFSLQGFSIATIRNSPTVPMAEEKIVARSSAPILATKPAATKSTDAIKPAAPTPFQVALDAGDLCEVSRLLNGNLQPHDIYAALIAVMSPSPALQEAYSATGPMMNRDMNIKPMLTHPSSDLLWALKLGGLIYGPVVNTNENPKAARALLLELEKKDPSNAFYPFFRLYLEDKLGFTKEQLKETTARLQTASAFDNNLHSLEAEFKQASWQSPAMHYVISNAHSTIAPSYYAPVNVLRRLSEEKEFSGMKSLAELTMEKGLRARRSYITGEYDVQLYSTGRGLVYQQGYPDWTELEAEKGRAPHAYPTQPWVTDEVTGERRCDPGPYETFFYEARESR